MSRRAFGLLLSVFGFGCSDAAEARDQWLVHVRTDASTPELFDRLLVDVLDGGGASACSSCRRQFGMAESGEVRSFGIAAPVSGAPLLLRVRLYQVRNTMADGSPLPGTAIDFLGRLPVLGGVTPVSVTLSMRCLGKPSSFERGETCSGELGAMVPIDVLPAEERPELPAWQPGRLRPCPEAVEEGMVCVPGGAFFMGETRALAVDALLTTEPQRLVALSPFALDAEELTVADYRELVARFGPFSEEPGRSGEAHCTWPGNDDAMPLNCVSRALAAELCEAQGKRLPTEAEWEFAARNRDRGTRYPWGDGDRDLCNRAIVAVDESPFSAGIDNSCRLERADTQAGPRAGGDRNDVSELGIYNLAGNLSEWLADRVGAYTGACWAYGEEPWLTDPRCDEGVAWAVRGGSWRLSPSAAQAFMRNGAGAGPATATGVRCARSFPREASP